MKQIDSVEMLKENFVLYAKEVNSNRAFPFVLSGVKPVVCHILWCMYQNKRWYNKPFTKSAKVDGEVMSYSPHGSCLTADTKMLLLSGEVKTLGELTALGKDQWVLSINQEGEIVPSLATAFRKTKEVNQLYHITFNNGYTIKATENHPFRSILGEWLRADQLEPGHVLDFARFTSKTGGSGYITKQFSIEGELKTYRDQPLSLPIVEKVEVIHCKTTPVYDFTVPGVENALISISEDDNLFTCAHNSYDSAVRLTQDFVHHVPLIEGHGSFGSAIGGQTPGASRYTEMRLSEFSHDSFFYNNNILDMGLNYLEEEPEPILHKWVSLMPILYISNTEGMGYTEANKWSSGNLFEFRDQVKHYLKTGKVQCDKVYPDFPTGGIIINKSELPAIYETGKGAIKLRGRTNVLNDHTIQVLSLPYQIYPEDFLGSVKSAIEKGLDTITNVSNYCGKNGFLIEITCQKGKADYTLEMLFKKTNLQVSISDNRRAVSLNGKPELYSLLDCVKVFVDANVEVVYKEAVYELEKINDRLEIVEGLLSALSMIDKIIKLIKSSKSQDESKKKIQELGFTEKQSQAIISTTLGRLANLEQVKLKDEQEELTKNKAYYTKLKDSKKEQEKYFFNRFSKLVDKYGWERKTEVLDIEENTEVIKEHRPTVKKSYMMVLTNQNTLKCVEVSKYKAVLDDKKAFKVESGDKVLLIADDGMMYQYSTSDIPKCNANALGFELPFTAVNMFFTKDKPFMLFVTEQGMVKKSNLADVFISKKVGTPVMKLKLDGDKVIWAELVSNTDELTLGKTLVKCEDVRESGRNTSGARFVKKPLSTADIIFKE